MQWAVAFVISSCILLTACQQPKPIGSVERLRVQRTLPEYTLTVTHIDDFHLGDSIETVNELIVERGYVLKPQIQSQPSLLTTSVEVPRESMDINAPRVFYVLQFAAGTLYHIDKTRYFKADDAAANQAEALAYAQDLGISLKDAPKSRYGSRVDNVGIEVRSLSVSVSATSTSIRLYDSKHFHGAVISHVQP